MYSFSALYFLLNSLFCGPSLPTDYQEEIPVERPALAEVFTGDCLNSRSTFKDESWSGWQSTDDDEIEIDDKEDRDEVLRMKDKKVEFYTDFSVSENSEYTFNFDAVGENKKKEKTKITVVWYRANNSKISEERLSDEAYQKKWRSYTLVANAPLGATRARWIFENHKANIWLDELCAVKSGGGVTTVPVAGECLLVNPAFSQGLTGWNFNTYLLTTASVIGGTATFANGVLSQKTKITPFKKYQVRFRLRSITEVPVVAILDNDPANSVQLSRIDTRGDWRTVYSDVFMASASPDVQLTFASGGLSTTQLDDVCLIELDTDNPKCGIPNANFNEGLEGWTTNGLVADGTLKGRKSIGILEDGELGNRIPIIGGISYDFTYALYGANKNNNVEIAVFYYNGSAYLSGSDIGERKYAETWTDQAHVLTPPDNATSMYVRIRVKDKTVYLDDMCLSQTLTSAVGCLNLNGAFDFGSAGWTVAGHTGSTTTSQNGNPFFRQHRGTLQSQQLAVSGSEEYFLNLRLREQEAGTGLWSSVKWLDNTGILIREEPVTITGLDNTWKEFEFRLIAPVNATAAILYFNMQDGKYDIDDVCLSPGASRATSCNTSDQKIGDWIRLDPSDGGTFQTVYIDGRDAFEVEKSSVFTEFPVEAGRTYRTRFLLNGSNDPSKPTQVLLSWLRTDGSTISTSTLATQAFATGWNEYIYRADAPVGAANARLVIANSATKINFSLYCNMDAGDIGAASVISGIVWDDKVGDGVRADTESPLGGARLALYVDDGDGVRNPALDKKVDERISTGDGEEFFFTDLVPGNYYIVGYLLPTKRTSAFRTGFADVDNDFEAQSLGGIAVGMTPLIAADGINDVSHVDMGQRPSGKAAVSGYVWNDQDDSSFRNEPNAYGLNGVTLRAVNATNGTTVATTITKDDPYGNPGFYLFNFVSPIPVYVQLVVPGSSTLLSKANDRKFDVVSNRSDILFLQPDVTFTNISAGLELTGTEVCDNGIDDDNDGRIDDRDSDCTSCVVADQRICGDVIRYYIPPMLRMTDVNGGQYNGPSYLFISTSADTANVVIKRSDGTIVSNQQVMFGQSNTVTLTEYLGQTKKINIAETNSGLFVESDQPVSVIYKIDGSLNKALVTIKGQQALGNKFRAGSQVAQYKCSGGLGNPNVSKNEAHFVSALATEDSTTVTFEWDASELTLAGGISSPYVVVLNAGESMLLRDDYTNQTVSGLGITSDKAISVVSGSQHTNVCGGGGLDAGIDQLVPECYVGSEYVVVKHKGLSNQHYAVVVATADDTDITLDGSDAILATIDAGEWHKVDVRGNLGDAHTISTTRPAYVYQVSGISTNNEVGMGLAAAVGDCRGNDYLSFPRNAGSEEHLLSIVVPTDELNSLSFNGDLVTGLSNTIVSAVPGRSDLTSVVVANTHIKPNNTLLANDRFTAALLIGKSGSSGTFGFLTSFSQEISVEDPNTSRPGSRYKLPRVCGGDSFDHTIEAESCGSVIEIVEISNNDAYGNITLLGGLDFTYESRSEAYGLDNLSIRLRDENGIEKGICIEVFVCGADVPVYGLAPSQTLSCSEAIPVSNPLIVDVECPYLGSIEAEDVITPGSCAGEYTVTRTWQAETACGTMIEAERVYYFVDNDPPTFTAVPAAKTSCGNAPVSLINPLVTDNCGATVDLRVNSITNTFAGTNRSEVIRTWTATDVCGNVATASQLITYIAYPDIDYVEVNDAACGQNTGAIEVNFNEDNSFSQIQFSINGNWQTPVAANAGNIVFEGLAAGTYAIEARWGSGACITSLGNTVIQDYNIEVVSLSFTDLDANTKQSITNGEVYHRKDLPANFNIEAALTRLAARVDLDISGGTVSDSKLDNSLPYRYPADDVALNWSVGTYTVTVSPFASTSAGTPCSSETFSFSIINKEICDNFIDDDGDGFIDCADQDCPGAMPVTRVTRG